MFGKKERLTMMKQKYFSVIALLGALYLWGATPAAAADSQCEDVWATDAEGNLTIHADRVPGEPVFIPLLADGKRMEVLVIRGGDGKVRLAFNTCQVCSGSPRAYFEPQVGGVVCRNCGNFFSAEQVGIASKGCNPLAVPGVEATASGDIVVPAAVLAAHADAFRNWKRGQ